MKAMKWIAIGLTVCPGGLFVLALLNYIVFSFLERDLPSGTANIGLGFLYIAAMINIPTVIAWAIVGILKLLEDN